MGDQAWAGVIVTARPSPSPRKKSPLRGYSSGFDQQQHIFFIDSDNHVCELYNLNAWKFTDLSQTIAASTGVAPRSAASASSLAGYETPSNDQLHVHFIGTDQHVHEFYYDGTWEANDLGGNLLPNTPLAGYQTGFNEQQHVVCCDAKDRVVEILYDGFWNPPLSILDVVNAQGRMFRRRFRVFWPFGSSVVTQQNSTTNSTWFS